MNRARRPRTVAPVGGFAAFQIWQILEPRLPLVLEQLALGPVHPKMIEELKETAAAVEESAGQFVEWWRTWSKPTHQPVPVPTATGSSHGHDEISTREAAEMLNCSTEWVRRLVDRGVLAGRRTSRVVLVNQASVMTYLLARGAA